MHQSKKNVILTNRMNKLLRLRSLRDFAFLEPVGTSCFERKEEGSIGPVLIYSHVPKPVTVQNNSLRLNSVMKH